MLRKIGYGNLFIYLLPDRYCLIKGDPQKYHLYFVETSSPSLTNWLKFKTILSLNPELVKSYNELKISLLSKYSDKPVLYTRGKSDFINKILGHL